ncbi:BglG family transcription antiterminator [Halobacillus karajensis]|uniref:Mannitol operon transcriptional activator n=1 Tax=Halobacillus karajensis TaxID=195088 RepID=A0A024P7U9_9BACI|nr:BglG family transcription antiterminator [Halobacillus karajensis]CDQ20148.1 Mannitol operon transcriptional activator [Halobacillus karajensis]CDQ25189.1 Mannitol operon transcriptional activator [Halobacillus karajensis]CDQ28450.1 Mannitol operon transcriptional activator [Halobacillus karajensis]
MVLDKRRAHLLSIIQQSHEPIPTKDLVAKMNMSQRTIYYDLDQINSWLRTRHLSPIESKHGKGLFLPHATKSKLMVDQDQSFEGWQYQLSKQEREVLIKAKILLEEQDASMQRFLDLTSMSRGTIAKVIKTIKQEFSEAGLQLYYQKGSGYRLSGPEEVKRTILSDILATIFSHPNWQNVRNEVHRMIQPEANQWSEETDQRCSVRDLLFEAEKELGWTLTDEMVEILSLQILMIIKRIELQKYINVQPAEKQVLQQTEAYQASLLIAKKLENLWEVAFPEDEVCFITMNLLGSKVQHDDFSRYTERERSGLKNVVQQMIADFQLYSCVVFDDKEGLEENLISHIKPTYYRLKYGVQVANDLAPSIQETYQDLFYLTKRVMRHLEFYVGKTIPDEEIAYITLHFGGWLTKEKKQVKTKFRAIIVCENGIGTSNMLRTQLENLIAGLNVITTLSMREYQRKEHQADVIFSTNYIKPKNIPVIHVPAILTNIEKERVIQRMNGLFDSKQTDKDTVDHFMDVIERHATIHHKDELKRELVHLLDQNSPRTKELRKPMLNELLTERTIQFKDQVSNWKEAIEIAAQPLVEQQSIRPHYIQAMIDNVNELGPYIVIAPRIAIPHARPETGVEQLGMSFLRLKEPVYFSEKEKHRAQLIIVLAAIDNQTHLKALAQLSGMLSNEDNVNQLIAANDSKNVIELINQSIEVS